MCWWSVLTIIWLYLSGGRGRALPPGRGRTCRRHRHVWGCSPWRCCHLENKDGNDIITGNSVKQCKIKSLYCFILTFLHTMHYCNGTFLPAIIKYNLKRANALQNITLSTGRAQGVISLYLRKVKPDPDWFADDWAVREEDTQLSLGLSAIPDLYELCHPVTATMKTQMALQDVHLAHTWQLKAIYLVKLLSGGKLLGLTSVASAAATGRTATPAASEATAGLPELLTGLPSLSPEDQRFATLTDGNTVTPSSASTCRQAQHTLENDRW